MYNSEGYCIHLNPVILFYYRRDHLGNNREVWPGPYTFSNGTTSTATTVQRTQYYPSGLPWASNSGDNPWVQDNKYNGKEFVEMHGLDEYDYHARRMYPAIMRFTTIDPLAELMPTMSPYAYCFNNQVRFIDPTGMISIGADGLINEQWIESSRPGADPSLRKQYQNENRALERFCMSNDISLESVFQESSGSYYYRSQEVRLWDAYNLVLNGFVINVASGWDVKGIKMYINLPMYDFDWARIANKASAFAVGGASTLNNTRFFIEYQYVKQARLDRARNGNFGRPIDHSLRSIKNTGKVLNYAGGPLIAADIAMSGEIKVSHAINGGMIYLSTTVWGAPIAGAWFILDYSTMGINLILSRGKNSNGLGDIIDKWTGGPLIEMYNGLY